MNDKDAPAKAEASAFVEVPRSVIAPPGQLLPILDETTQTKQYAPAKAEAYCFAARCENSVACTNTRLCLGCAHENRGLRTRERVCPDFG